MYPLKNWETYKRGYTFGQKTFYSNFHLGLDIVCPQSTPLIAWQDLVVTKVLLGVQGGNTIWIKADGKLFRCMHLVKPGKLGVFKQGEVIGYTGNTGTSTAPHLHIDISKNGNIELDNHSNFIDPEVYFKQLNEEDMKPTKDLAREFEKLVGRDPGDNMNDNEQDEFAKEIKKLREKPETVCPPVTDCSVYIQQVEDLTVENQALHGRITELEPKADVGNRFAETVRMAQDLTK